MEGGDALALEKQKKTAVWWDLNTCPVPAGVEPGRVVACIESALEKEMGHGCDVYIYAIGNLEYISSDLLEQIGSSGIDVIHAPCRGNDLYHYLREWSRFNPHLPRANVMLISCDYTLADPCLFRLVRYTGFIAYPEDDRPLTLDHDDGHTVFVKEFVWETLLNDNMSRGEIVSKYDEPSYTCDICYDTFEVCGEFVTHLKSDEHKKEMRNIAPIDSFGKYKHFCQACNYAAYDYSNLLIHNQSEEHNLKVKNLAKENAQEKDCESSKRSPQVHLLNERNKMQSVEQEDVA